MARTASEDAIEQIGKCGFQCEAGPLEMCVAYQWLVAHVQLLEKELADRLQPEPQTPCTIPPKGWKCTRGFHIGGPCAAVPDPDNGG